MLRKQLIRVGAILLLSSFGCQSPEGRAFQAKVLNKPAPDFELEALGGGSMRLSKQKGKPVVLAFFAHG